MLTIWSLVLVRELSLIVEMRSRPFIVIIEMLLDAGVSFDQCDCKYNMLLTSRRLEIAGAVRLTLTSDERVTTAQGASRVVDGAAIYWLGVYLSLERRPLLISRFLVSVLKNVLLRLWRRRIRLMYL